MLRRFIADRRGNFAMMTAIATVPLLGGLALAIDFTEVTRQRQETLNALDAAGIATARQVVTGASDEALQAYAKAFFEANLNAVDPANTTLTVVLPNNDTGGGTLKMSASLKYKPYFLPAFVNLVNHTSGAKVDVDFSAKTEVRLKNTLEVALVLDNSGSMKDPGAGSSKARIDLLKEAAKKLLDTMSAQAGAMKQITKPIQFSLVPFAASVNVGSSNADATWMDTQGISPVHHENFDWATMAAADSTKKVEQSGGSGPYYRRGTGWGTDKDKIITRFSLFSEMKQAVQTGTEQYCSQWNSKGTKCLTYSNRPVYSNVQYTSWLGCVETRPHPYNVNDAAAASGTPATMFVPMFAPDETDKLDGTKPGSNNWLNDMSADSSSAVRQRYMPKYFQTSGFAAAANSWDGGPNSSCTTKPITPLTDVTETKGLTDMKTAIDNMAPLGGTNVPEGVAWGWRSISGGAPFTEGRPDAEKGNDKVMIVLTDGANTYYTPTSVIAASYSNFNNTGNPNTGGNDLAGSKALYSSFGYLVPYNKGGYTYGRLFQGTSSSITKTDYSNANYSKALNEQMAQVCTNAKTAKIIIMTIALDLDATKGTAEQKAQTQAQITGLTDCASPSRFKAGKLFWNTKGGDLDKTFKEIADELSNLRIVG